MCSFARVLYDILAKKVEWEDSTMLQHQMFELTFPLTAPLVDWSQPELAATFTCAGTSTTVKGFYDGDNTYKIRFLPEICGEYHWEVTGLHVGVYGNAHL